MKRRVRGLLRSNWLSPLAALLLVGVPLLVVGLVIFFLFRPGVGAAPDTGIVWSFADPSAMLLQLLLLFSDPIPLLTPLLGWLPMVGVLAGIGLFIGMPLFVSVSSYFLAFLRGKKPKVTDVYGVFSAKYPRALGGMAYRTLWLCIWFVVAFIVPTVLIFASVPFVSSLGIELSTQIYAFLAVLFVCLLWYIIFACLFINRLLAYCLTPVCIAAQPNLPAYRAVRLSRKLMRGSKWRVIGLFFSFIHYFLPAVVAGALLLLLKPLGDLLALDVLLQGTLRMILWGIVLLNQLVWVFVAPYIAASFNAFYIERKREALMDGEVEQEDFSTRGRDGKQVAENTGPYDPERD